MHFYSIRPTMYQLCRILFQISKQGVLCRRTGKYFLSHLRIFIIKKEKKIKVHIIYIYIYIMIVRIGAMQDLQNLLKKRFVRTITYGTIRIKMRLLTECVMWRTPLLINHGRC